MCKIICLTNTSQIADKKGFADEMRKLLLDHKDGFGYAYQNEDNTLFGAKTTRPLAPISSHDIPWCETNGEHFGSEKPGNTKGGLFHGRTSTNAAGLINTHPILKEGWGLIHNGVVQDWAPGAVAKARLTGNDTEYILDHLMTSGINPVAEFISGYYAVGAFGPDGSMHIFRDKVARLQCAYSKKLDSYVFATTEEIIHSIGKLIDETLWASTMNDETYLRFENGRPVEQTTFRSRGYTQAESKWSQKSLGHDLESATDDGWPWDHYKGYPAESSKKIDRATQKEMDLLDRISDEFLDLIDKIDDSYTIHDWHGRIMTAMEFSKLRFVEQVKCHIKDYDGKKIRKYRQKEKPAYGKVSGAV